MVDETVTPAHQDNTSRLSHLYSQCRDACGDPAGLRIVAASALVVGLMLSSAPAALAQVRNLLTTAPTTFTLDNPTRDEPIRDDPTMSTGDSPVKSAAWHRLTIRSAMALIRWKGTRHALRCAFGLLFDGNTGNCTREPIVLASSYRRLLA